MAFVLGVSNKEEGETRKKLADGGAMATICPVAAAIAARAGVAWVLQGGAHAQPGALVSTLPATLCLA